MIKPAVRYFFDNKRMIFTFLSVGLTTAILNFLVFGLMYHGLHLEYRISVSVSYVMSVIFYFFINRAFTFKPQSGKVHRQMGRFIGLLIINYLITLIVMQLSVSELSLSPYIGLFLAIGSTTMISFFVSRYWVFKS